MKITPEAAAAIQSLLWDKRQMGGGLRIFLATPAEDGSRLDMGIAVTKHPDPTDEVVAEHGSRVFVEQRLSPALAGKTLDVAESDDEGGIGFRLIT